MSLNQTYPICPRCGHRHSDSATCASIPSSTSNFDKTTLRLWTFGASSEDRHQAIRLEWDGGLVKIHCLDPAYDDFMDDLVRNGCYSNELGRTVTVDDGLDLLRGVEGLLVNSSYWWAEWV